MGKKEMIGRLEGALAALRDIEEGGVQRGAGLHYAKMEIICVLNDLYEEKHTAQEDETYLRVVQ